MNNDKTAEEYVNNRSVDDKDTQKNTRIEQINVEDLTRAKTEARETSSLAWPIISIRGTVWKRGLLLNMAEIIKCKKTLRLLECMLSNRKFKVFLNGKASKHRYFQNGLPRVSVILPVHFNIYTSDITETTARKLYL